LNTGEKQHELTQRTVIYNARAKGCVQKTSESRLHVIHTPSSSKGPCLFFQCLSRPRTMLPFLCAEGRL